MAVQLNVQFHQFIVEKMSVRLRAAQAPECVEKILLNQAQLGPAHRMFAHSDTP